jgi:hypothetical protein
MDHSRLFQEVLSTPRLLAQASAVVKTILIKLILYNRADRQSPSSVRRARFFLRRTSKTRPAVAFHHYRFYVFRGDSKKPAVLFRAAGFSGSLTDRNRC